MRRSIPLIMVLGLVAAACGGGGGGQPSPEPNGVPTEGGEPTEGGGPLLIAGQEANDHGFANVVGEDEFELEADDFYFEPTVLQGDPGQTLTLEVRNKGSATHTFTIQDQGLDAAIEAGEDVKVQVQFPEDGALVFICRFHESQGMRGGLSAEGSLDPPSGSAAGAGKSSGGGSGSGDGGGGYGYG